MMGDCLEGELEGKLGVRVRFKEICCKRNDEES